MATVSPSCMCGHPKAEHLNQTGECNEPGHRCSCGQYLELCPECNHAQYAHNGAVDGHCTRITMATNRPCGCKHYGQES